MHRTRLHPSLAQDANADDKTHPKLFHKPSPTYFADLTQRFPMCLSPGRNWKLTGQWVSNSSCRFFTLCNCCRMQEYGCKFANLEADLAAACRNADANLQLVTSTLLPRVRIPMQICDSRPRRDCVRRRRAACRNALWSLL